MRHLKTSFFCVGKLFTVVNRIAYGSVPNDLKEHFTRYYVSFFLPIPVLFIVFWNTKEQLVNAVHIYNLQGNLLLTQSNFASRLKLLYSTPIKLKKGPKVIFKPFLAPLSDVGIIIKALITKTCYIKLIGFNTHFFIIHIWHMLINNI